MKLLLLLEWCCWCVVFVGGVVVVVVVVVVVRFYAKLGFVWISVRSAKKTTFNCTGARARIPYNCKFENTFAY